MSRFLKEINTLIPIYSKLIKFRVAVNKRRTKKAKDAKKSILNEDASKKVNANLAVTETIVVRKNATGNTISKDQIVTLLQHDSFNNRNKP